MTEYVIWIDREKQVVSFHEEAGYERMVFTYHEYFLQYLMELQEKSFRFM